MTIIYTTKSDYINHQVLPALPPEMHYLAGEVASHMLIWHDEVDENGNVRVDKSGFVVDPDADVMDIIVTNKNDLEMSLTVSQGNKTLFTKCYDLNNIDVMIEDLEKHHMVLV